MGNVLYNAVEKALRRMAQEECSELTRRRESIRQDKYELSSTIETLYEQFDYCPESHEDALSAEIYAKQALYNELSVKEDELVEKIDGIRRLW